MPPQLHSLYLIICCLSLCRCYIHIIKFNRDINVIIRLLFQLGQKNYCLHMNGIFLVFCFIYFLVIYYDSFISFCLYIKEILLLLMILFNLKYYIITYISWARRGHCPRKYKFGSTEVLPISQSLFTYSPIAFLNFFHTFSFIIGARQCFPLTSK